MNAMEKFLRSNVSIKPENYTTYKGASNLTELEFIDWITNGAAKYAIDNNDTSAWLKKDIQLNNSQISKSNYNVYQIADFEHDGTEYTVDLIAKNTVIDDIFDSTDNDYIKSDIRTWLNGTYYNGFDSTLRNRMVNMTVKTDRVGTNAGTGQGGTSQTTSDKVKLLSCAEIGLSTSASDYIPNKDEGTRYPIFLSSTSTAATDRVRTGASSYWWLRSRSTYDTSSAWYVFSDGSVSSGTYYGIYGILPVLRFSVS